MEPAPRAPIASGAEARPQADWREGRQDTLLSLARRPLDLWRPATPPEATEGPATVESSPLSLRYLAEAEMERWSERAFPAHDPRRDGSGAPLAAAWRQGKRLLERALAERLDFAFETTLGGGTMTPFPCGTTPS